MTIPTLAPASTNTMSSREIATICNKEHKNVIRVIEHAKEAQILTAQIEPLDFIHRGNTYKHYELSKKDSMYVVARLSPEFTMAIIDRWEELESQAALPDFTNPEVITNLLTTLQDSQSENKRLNRVCNDLANQLSSGITACQFAKLLNGVNSQQIQGVLINEGWLKNYAGGKLRGIRIPSKGRNAGYFVQNWTDKKDFKVGSALLTESGAKWLYKKYQDGKLPMLKNWNGQTSHDLFLSEVPVLNLPALKAVKNG